MLAERDHPEHDRERGQQGLQSDSLRAENTDKLERQRGLHLLHQNRRIEIPLRGYPPSG